jgi:hypothetical protein
MGFLKGLVFALAGLAAMLIILHFALHQGQRIGGPVGGVASWVDSHVNG